MTLLQIQNEHMSKILFHSLINEEAIKMSWPVQRTSKKLGYGVGNLTTKRGQSCDIRYEALAYHAIFGGICYTGKKLPASPLDECHLWLFVLFPSFNLFLLIRQYWWCAPTHTSDTSVKTGRLTDSRCLRKSLSSHELSTKLTSTHSKECKLYRITSESH